MTPSPNPQETIRDLKKRLAMFERIFDSIYNGALVTDARGIITHFNQPYGKFLGMDPRKQIGKHCTEVVENTRMHMVARTGKAEINQAHRIKGQNMVVQRIPIKKDGKVVAVFGQVMFKDVRDVRELAEKLSLLESKVRLYEQELIHLRASRYTFEGIVGASHAMRDLKKAGRQAATNNYPVLITGESGTGKGLFAQAIHHASARKRQPFVRINCAAIPRDLLESELFGYERGAFTGALTAGKPGKFEVAHKGTIFLDEIGDLPLEMQPKLLRVLEDREFERIGGNRIIRSDFRLIAATNQPLEEMVAEGRFRKDLFYRLNVISLHIPPLRDRKMDISPLAAHLLEKLAREAAYPKIRMSAEVEAVFQRHDWPGNVREMSNVLERALSVLEGDIVEMDHLPFHLCRKDRPDLNPLPAGIREVQHQAEKTAILTALEQTRYNKARAAELLGIHRTLLYKKMKKHGIALHP
jgi:PAS domain S-box-containing protein